MKNRLSTKAVVLGSVFILLSLLFCTSTFSSPQIEVYFSPHGGAQEAIAERIDKAQESVDVAMYAFTSRELASALIKAHQKGIKVRVLLDSDFSSSCEYSKEHFLSQYDIELRVYRNRLKGENAGGKMHHKFAIVDQRILIFGSYNWTASAEKRNCENLLIVTQVPKLIKTFQQNFNRLWQQGETSEEELIPEAVISATDLRGLRNHIDRFIAVEGEVKKVGYSERSNTYFLNFDVVRPCFTAVIFSSAVERFQAERKDPRGYQGKKVKISGQLIEHPKYGLEIILEGPIQIEEINNRLHSPAQSERGK